MEHLKALLEFIEKDELPSTVVGDGLPTVAHVISGCYFACGIGGPYNVYHSILDFLPHEFKGILLSKIELGTSVFSAHSAANYSAEGSKSRKPFDVIVAGTNIMGYDIGSNVVTDTSLKAFPVFEKLTTFFGVHLREMTLRPFDPDEFTTIKAILQHRGLRHPTIFISSGPLTHPKFQLLGGRTFTGLIPSASGITRSITAQQLYPVSLSSALPQNIRSAADILNWASGALLGYPTPLSSGRAIVTATFCVQDPDCPKSSNLTLAPGHPNGLASHTKTWTPHARPFALSAGPSYSAAIVLRWVLDRPSDVSIESLLQKTTTFSTHSSNNVYNKSSSKSLEPISGHQHFSSGGSLEGALLVQSSASSDIAKLPDQYLKRELSRLNQLLSIVRSNSSCNSLISDGAYATGAATNGFIFAHHLWRAKFDDPDKGNDLSKFETEEQSGNTLMEIDVETQTATVVKQFLTSERPPGFGGLESTNTTLDTMQESKTDTPSTYVADPDSDFTDRFWAAARVLPTPRAIVRALELVLRHLVWGLNMQSGTAETRRARQSRVARMTMNKNSTFTKSNPSKTAHISPQASFGVQVSTLPQILPSIRTTNSSMLGTVLARVTALIRDVKYDTTMASLEDGNNPAEEGLIQSCLQIISENWAALTLAELCLRSTTRLLQQSIATSGAFTIPALRPSFPLLFNHPQHTTATATQSNTTSAASLETVRRTVLLEGERARRLTRIAEVTNLALSLQAPKGPRQSVTRQVSSREHLCMQQEFDLDNNTHVKSSIVSGGSSESLTRPLRVLLPLNGTNVSQMVSIAVNARQFGSPVSLELKWESQEDQTNMDDDSTTMMDINNNNDDKNDSDSEMQLNNLGIRFDFLDGSRNKMELMLDVDEEIDPEASSALVEQMWKVTAFIS